MATRLWAYRLTGELLHRLPLGHGDKQGDKRDAALQVQPDTGSAWVGLHEQLYHISAQGAWLSVHTWPDPVRALAWDPTRACLWVATQEQVSALTDAGAWCAHLEVGSHAEIRDLAVDPASGVLWLALKKALRSYAADGTLRFELRADKLQRLVNDYQGGVWGTTDRTLFRVDPWGRLLMAVEPFEPRDKLVALVADPTEASVWVAAARELRQLGPDGRQRQRVPFKSDIRALAFSTDATPPSLAFTAPRDGDLLNTITPLLTLQYGDSGAGVDLTSLAVQANDADLPIACRYSDAQATCTPAKALADGPVMLTASVRDYAGNVAAAPAVQVTIDSMAPAITLATPSDGLVTNQAQQLFAGTLSEAATLTLNGAAVRVNPDLTFTYGPVALQEGLNSFELLATDAAGNRRQRQVRLTLDSAAPTAVNPGQVAVQETEPGQVQISGPAGSVEAGARLTLTNTRTGQAFAVAAGSDGSFTALLAAQPGDVIAIAVADAAGNASPESQVPVGGTLPPDPATVAPPLDRTVATDLATATAFLYTGSHPIQTGMAPETIEPRRMAVLRGRVQSRDEAPLPGVTIAILGHPEFGQTVTRADGMFDLAMNGGGLLTVRYEKEGYLPVQRQVQSPWRDYAWLPDVVLLPYDPQVTTIDLAAADLQMARGSVVSDADGTRQATLLFAPGTQATMVLPDGTTQPLSTLHVRATEYTVGPTGPQAMPGTLPPASAYTYAVELSVDEAVAAGATEVRFTQPVIFYVDDFLDFPTGISVPMGFYDPRRDVWVPSQNGRVVKVLSVADSAADLDITGDDIADDTTALAALGITEGERQRLASLYQPGQRLWRASITHFSAWDANWGWGPPADATPPLLLSTLLAAGKPLDDPTCQSGSIIKCENQSLGEVVGITGTAFRLHYQSDRVPGHTAANVLQIPLSSSNMPPSLKQIELEIEVAGRRFSQSFPAAPDQSVTFVWDGLDGYGRPLQSAQPITVRVGYTYQGTYQRVERFGYTGNGIPISGSRTRQEVTLWREWRSTIGPWDARMQSLGGWSLNVHHAYDPGSRVLHLGDGGRRSAKTLGYVMTTVAGNGTLGSSGDGGPATQAQLDRPPKIAIGSDGSLYIADATNNRIRRVGLDGIITTVAGNGTYGFSGDGGPAIRAQLDYPNGVAVGPDGSLYIADSSNDRVRRVGPDGIITTVAGGGVNDFGGDGGPATQAQLNFPVGIAVGQDGSLYIADSDNHRIRRVRPDGIITTIAGNGTNGFSGDGGPATQAQLAFPYDVAVGSDGNLYIADTYNTRIRRVELPLADFPLDDIVTPSDDGAEIYVFDRNGRHLRTLDAFSGAMRYQLSYDSAGHLVALTDGNGHTTTIERDASGNPTTIIAPFGQRTTLRLDAHGYLASVIDPAGHSTQLTYTADGLLTELAPPRGNRSRFTYDPQGRLIRDEDPAGGFKTLTRRELPSGFEVTLATALGRATSHRVEEFPTGDRRRLNTFPSGLQEELWMGSDGRRITTLPDETVQSLLLGPEPRFGMQSPLTTHIHVKTPHGLESNATSARTITLSDPHNPLTLLTQTDVLTLNGNAYTSTFEATLGRLTHRTPAGRQSATLLDGQGRVVEVQRDGFSPLRYTYDARGRLTAITQGPRTAAFSYDTQGYLAGITDSLARSVGFEYDSAGRLTRQALPDGREILYAYDADGNVTSITPPGRPSHAFTYTPVDLEAAYLPPALDAGPTPTQYAYNLDRQLVQVNRPDGTTLDLSYDGAGRLSTLTFPQGKVGFGYHPSTGNLATITAPDGGTLTYDYDGSLLTSEAWSGSVAGRVQYAYDNDFRLIAQQLNGEVLATLQYDADGLLTQAGALTLSRDPRHGLLTGSALGQITDTWTYTSLGEPDSYRARFGGTEIFAVQYGRDALGRIIQKTETLEGQTTTYTYAYDMAGRLTAVTRDGRSIAAYAYDSNGNRVSYTSPDGTIPGMYDGQDRLAQYGSTTYTYTANGEVQSKTTGTQTTIYTYDALGNLVAVTLPNGTQIDYVIDGRQRRIGKKINGALVHGFLYSGQLRPVAELDSNGAVTARFIYGSRGNVPDYMIKGGYTYRILTDHLGSPRIVIDTNTGHIVQRMAYDAFGRVTFDDNPGFQPFGFAGGLYDPDTQLTRFGARDYDAETGRWTAKDPIRFLGGDPNLYGYVLNDPVNWVDPWGLEWTDWQENIWATLEGTVEESPILKAKTSYGKNTNTDLFVALPDENLKGKKIELEVNGRTVTVEVGDIGPWNGGHTRSGKSLNDPYWENNGRPQAECGTDLRGRKTNKAGIDISAALAKQLGLKGNTRVRWRGLP